MRGGGKKKETAYSLLFRILARCRASDSKNPETSAMPFSGIKEPITVISETTAAPLLFLTASSYGLIEKERVGVRARRQGVLGVAAGILLRCS